MACDLQEDIEKLNNGIAFLIRHSQKLFKVISHKKRYDYMCPLKWDIGAVNLNHNHSTIFTFAVVSLKAPPSIKEYARIYFTGSKTLQSKVFFI